MGFRPLVGLNYVGHKNMPSFVTTRVEIADSVRAFMDAPEYWRDAIGSHPKYFVHVESSTEQLFGLSKFCAFRDTSLEDYVTGVRNTIDGGTTQKLISRVCGNDWTPLKSTPRKLQREFRKWFDELTDGKLNTDDIHLLTVDLEAEPKTRIKRIVSPKVTEIPEAMLVDISQSFGGNAFSTLQFANALESLYPATMDELETKYGKGGASAGKHYSAYSRIAHALDKLVKTQALVKLDYRKAPDSWGSPIIRYWCTPGVTREFPEEVPFPETVWEGAKRSVLVNIYERDQTARAKCIKEWGTICTVCGFDFQRRYGDLDLGYIHVHHLKPLSEIREEYALNPITDLRPVCANCHAMLHRSIPALSIESLKSLLQ